MANLTRVAYVSRKLIKFGGSFLVLFLIAWTLMTSAIAAYRAAHPVKLSPTVRYGVLPKIVFPEKPAKSIKYALELPNDDFPKLPDQAKVYVVYRPVSSFLALEQDTKTAYALGFTSKPIEISPGVYQFKNNNLNQTLVMNVLDGSFKMEYPYLTDQLLVNAEKVPDKSAAISIASSYLNSAAKLSYDLDQGEKKVSYWKIEFSGLKEVPSQSEADLIRVDFFRKNLEENVKIISTEIGKASVSVLVSGSQVASRKVVEVNYKHANIDAENFSTYPIKTAQQAWDDLKNNNYWLATEYGFDAATIRSVALAYFEPVTLTNYMQPIYVFSGDNNFVGYVPAIINKYTN